MSKVLIDSKLERKSRRKREKERKSFKGGF
jgi:hypothetical protein